MILLDVNLLVYAGVSTFPQHGRARTWLDGQLSGQSRVGFPWHALLGYLRGVNNARAFEHPEPIADAWRRVQTWLGAEPAWIPEPGDRHAELLGDLLAIPGVHGNLIPDAHLAALAIEHGLTLCSADTDFARFPRLHWLNPLAL